MKPLIKIAGVVLAAAFLCGADAGQQGDARPAHDLPNPYQSVAPWGKLPGGRKWGALNGVAIDRDGVSLWVADRCGANPDTPPGVSPFQYDSCAGSKLPPVLKFDAAGNLLRSFGTGMFIFPHKIYVDREGNVWVADLRGVNVREGKAHPGESGKGHTVTKFSPEGKVLYRIPDPLELAGTSAAEGVAVDAQGNVYGGEVGPRQLVKHFKR